MFVHTHWFSFFVATRGGTGCVAGTGMLGAARNKRRPTRTGRTVRLERRDEGLHGRL